MIYSPSHFAPLLLAEKSVLESQLQKGLAEGGEGRNTVRGNFVRSRLTVWFICSGRSEIGVKWRSGGERDSAMGNLLWSLAKSFTFRSGWRGGEMLAFSSLPLSINGDFITFCGAQPEYLLFPDTQWNHIQHFRHP